MCLQKMLISQIKHAFNHTSIITKSGQINNHTSARMSATRSSGTIDEYSHRRGLVVRTDPLRAGIIRRVVAPAATTCAVWASVKAFGARIVSDTSMSTEQFSSPVGRGWWSMGVRRAREATLVGLRGGGAERVPSQEQKFCHTSHLPRRAVHA